MNTKQATILSLMTLALILGPGSVEDAAAKLQVHATVRALGVQVQIGDLRCHHNVYRDGHRRVGRQYQCRVADFEVDRHDRRIAKRLAGFVGVSSRELLHLRRHGYRWNEIGRQYDLSRRVVRAAMSQDSWRKFLRHDRRIDRQRDDRNERCDHRPVQRRKGRRG